MSYGVIFAQGINTMGRNPGSNQNASSAVIVKLQFLVEQKINPEPLGLSHIKLFPRDSSSFCEFIDKVQQVNKGAEKYDS